MPDLPELIVFDVNETLSDMSPIGDVFARIGLEGQAEAWFAALLRDGFALTAVRERPTFADLAAGSLRVRLGGSPHADDAVDEVMSAFRGLEVHPDVVEGMRALHEYGARLVTLSNGAAAVAESLLERAGLLDVVERLLSVEQAPAWKPHPASYAYALDQCGVAAGDAMLVAVHPWDIDGAARAGLRTGWLDRKGAPWPAYFREPDVTAPDLVGLARMLGG